LAKAETQRIRLLIAAATGILEAEFPMTVRQLFYRLVSAEQVLNTRGDYQKVSRMMTTARADGRCKYEWIVDRSRPEYTVGAFDDPGQFIEAMQSIYRKDYWKLQPKYVEIWTEKDAIVGSIQATTNELGVTVRVTRGFSSTTKVHEVAEHFASVGKPITVFYLGDHDPSGRLIEADMQARVHEHGSGAFTMRRLAIHAGDIRKFKLPPLRVKPSDSRADAFVKRYSDKCVELDALPPRELRQRIQDAVEDLQDREIWDRAVAVEKVEVQSIQDLVALWPKTA
jgi:hypothetical protein